jgi:hypothetical protein
MCVEIIEMFSKGKTYSNFCGKHVISEKTYCEWRKKHALFDKACFVAHQQARDYFDNLRQEYLVQEFEGASINWGLFNRMYNVRFNIPDKRLITVKALGKAKNEKEMLKSIMRAVSEGELTPDEAQKLASLIDLSIKIDQNVTQEKRLCAVEQAQRIGSSEDGFEEVASESS